MPSTDYVLERSELRSLFDRKYSRYGEVGWGPLMRLRLDYYTPDDHYEAMVSRLITAGVSWCDVGCGRDIFPNFPELGGELAGRAGFVFGIDPDDNILENKFINERFHGIVEDCNTTHRFDLITMRMVAEHIADPARSMAKVSELLKPGGRLVIYTPHKWAPMSIVANTVPFGLHHPFKRFLWDTEARDTFATQYKLNTRKDLQRHCGTAGMREEFYERLDDCRITGGFRWLNQIELWLRTAARAVGLGYPEACILTVYRKPASAAAT